jgi:hypothetical protein
MTERCSNVAIGHDYYLFSAPDFVETVHKHLQILQQDGVDAFIASVLEVFDQNTTVQRLAGEYGGWDKQALKTEISSTTADDKNTLGLWLVLLLYGQMTTEKPLVSFTSTQARRGNESYLLQGQPLSEGLSDEILPYLNVIRPQSICGDVQWIPNRRIEALHQSDAQQIPEMFQNLLFPSTEQRLDICIIVSG